MEHYNNRFHQTIVLLIICMIYTQVTSGRQVFWPKVRLSHCMHPILEAASSRLFQITMEPSSSTHIWVCLQRHNHWMLCDACISYVVLFPHTILVKPTSLEAFQAQACQLQLHAQVSAADSCCSRSRSWQWWIWGSYKRCTRRCIGLLHLTR